MKLLIAAALMSLVGCGGTSAPAVSQDAVIALDRDPVQVAAAYVGTSQNVSLQILNQGRNTLTVTSIKLELPDGGPLAGISAGGVFDQPLVAVDAGTLSDQLPVQIGGLQAGFVQFTYAPRGPGKSTALLAIESDAKLNPHFTTIVTACAVKLDGGSCN